MSSGGSCHYCGHYDCTCGHYENGVWMVPIGYTWKIWESIPKEAQYSIRSREIVLNENINYWRDIAASRTKERDQARKELDKKQEMVYDI